MQNDTQRRRAGKRLLVAAIGVATVSYVSTQSGCAAGGETAHDVSSEDVAPYDDEEGEAEIGSASQALQTSLTVKKPAMAAVKKLPWEIIVVRPPVGNLMGPPVGNLMAPPIDVITDVTASEAAGLTQVK